MRRRIIIYVVVLEIVVVLIFSVYGLLKLSKRTKELTAKNDLLDQKMELVSSYGSLEQDIFDTNRKIDETKNKFFTDDTLLSFLRNLSTVAQSMGVHVSNINLSNLVPADTEEIKELPITIEVTADLNNLIKFLSYLEDYGKCIRENSFSFSVASESSTIISFSAYVITKSQNNWIYGGE